MEMATTVVIGAWYEAKLYLKNRTEAYSFENAIAIIVSIFCFFVFIASNKAFPVEILNSSTYSVCVIKYSPI